MKVRGLSPKLPLTISDTDGYTLIKTYKEMVSQNLKMILLTIPGERIMEPAFGVGLRQYLFEQNTGSVYNDIESNIVEQLNIYMPYADLSQIDFINSDINPDLDDAYLSISMAFYIKPLEEIVNIELNFDLNSQLLISDS